jgi:Ala-tRNA(Pro) deacylase
MPAKKLKAFLDAAEVNYESITHTPAFTAQEVAQSAHIAGRTFAKTVIIVLDGKLAMAVLPANRKVVLQDIRDITGSEDVRFASEEEFRQAFPDCDTGAMPPFGNLYGMEVYLAESLTNDREIAFNAGTHTEILKVAFADFERLVHPKVVSFTT